MTKRLALRDPQFKLERVGDRIIGNIISTSFRGKDDYKRQELIHEALDAEFGTRAKREIGMFLAYTPEEWHFDDLILGLPIPKKTKKKAG